METSPDINSTFHQNIEVINMQYNDEVDRFEKEETEIIVRSVVSILICIFGLVGNSLAIFVIFALKEYRKSATYWYILQLAIADTLFLITLPFKVSEDFSRGWIYPEWLCKAKETILFLNYYGSVLFLLVISIDRYIIICKTFSPKWKKLRSHKSTLVVTVVVWIIAVLICIPVMLYSFKVGNDPNCVCAYMFPEDVRKSPEELCAGEREAGNESYLICLNITTQSRSTFCHSTSVFPELDPEFYDDGYDYYNDTEYTYDDEYDVYPNITDQATLESNCHYKNAPNSFVAFILFNSIVMFFLPLLLIFICYGLIVARLLVSRPIKDIATESSSYEMSSYSSAEVTPKKKKTSSSDGDRRRVTLMCGVFVLAFVCCWLPFHVVHMAKINGIYNTSSSICDGLLRAGSLLVYFNSALNPYLYNFLGTKFKQRFRAALAVCRSSIRGQVKETSHSSNNSNRFDFYGVRKDNKFDDKTAVSNFERYADDTTLMTTTPEVQPAGVSIPKHQDHVDPLLSS